jgi:hypothetical protein
VWAVAGSAKPIVMAPLHVMRHPHDASRQEGMNDGQYEDGCRRHVQWINWIHVCCCKFDDRRSDVS